MSSYRDLLVWSKAKSLAVLIYEQTNIGDFARDFGLRDQVRRAAVSIASNIAEGAERNTNKESVQFFYIAKGSLAEVITQIEISSEIGFLSTEKRDIILRNCEEISNMLSSLIRVRSTTAKPKPQYLKT
ncbi:MAG: four helix bundle protein [Abditibacteriaceae bacterium]